VNNAGRFLKNNGSGKADRAAIRLKGDCRPFKDLPSGAHPRTQDRRMGLGCVMGMVPFMGHRLRIGHPADEQQADDHADGNGPESASSPHRGEY